MAFRNRIVGLVRFSYPALSGFSVKPADPADLQAMLYDRARLERRFALFETLALPALKTQTDTDFEVMFLIGTDLPPWAKDRLRAGLTGLQARIVELPPMHHYPATQRAFASLPDAGETHMTSFRLDDDDGIDHDHIARLRRIANGVAKFTATPFCVTQNRGLFVDLTRKAPKFIETVEKMPLSIGVALCAPAGYPDTIFRRNHRLLPQFFTTFSQAEDIAYLRSVHGTNDSTAHTTGVVTDRSADEAAALLAQHFATTPQMLNRLALALRS